MKFKFAIALGVGALFAANPAFATANIGDLSSPGFSYGTLTSGTPFVAYNPYAAGASQCLGYSGCYVGTDMFAIIAQSHTPGTLLVHPGPGLGGNSAVRYTIAAAGDYNLSALFSSADAGAKSVGYFTIVGGMLTLYNSGSVSGIGTLSIGRNFTLAAGDSLGIFVNNGDGNYFNDSTNVAGAISAIPESATWAMMLLGFGMAGFGLRRRRRAALRVVYA